MNKYKQKLHSTSISRFVDVCLLTSYAGKLLLFTFSAIQMYDPIDSFLIFVNVKSEEFPSPHLHTGWGKPSALQVTVNVLFSSMTILFLDILFFITLACPSTSKRGFPGGSK